jgi:Fe-S cluster biogenesis protein NfuA
VVPGLSHQTRRFTSTAMRQGVMRQLDSCDLYSPTAAEISLSIQLVATPDLSTPDGTVCLTTENATAGFPGCASGAVVIEYRRGCSGCSASSSSPHPGLHDGCEASRSSSVGHSSLMRAAL